MTESILFFTHYALLLVFGIVLSFAFCGLHFSKKNILFISIIFVLCGTLQLVTFYLLGETKTWELYPLISHVPLGVFLCTILKKRIVTSIASISLSYLCCQPAKWMGLLFDAFTDNEAIILSIKSLTVVIVAFIFMKFFASYISEIFNKDSRSVFIFSSMPLVYYLFDYTVEIYTDLWNTHYRVVTEFLAFFLCIFFVVFCGIYYKEYEKKADAERKKQIIEITVQQQAKEMDAIKKSNLETRLLRHDMRLLLDNLALSIEQNDKENSLKMISGFARQVDSASVHRYCENDTINYILTNFEAKCCEMGVAFSVTVEINQLPVDEVLFCSIVSNALDNALNAQLDIPKTNRQIRMMLKDSDGKLLFSVKNPFKERPVFVDGLPISNKKGHGYGTQSIRYMTERLKGKCQFTLENNMFVLRVIL